MQEPKLGQMLSLMSRRAETPDSLDAGQATVESFASSVAARFLKKPITNTQPNWAPYGSSASVVASRIAERLESVLVDHVALKVWENVADNNVHGIASAIAQSINSGTRSDLPAHDVKIKE